MSTCLLGCQLGFGFAVGIAGLLTIVCIVVVCMEIRRAESMKSRVP